MTRYMSPWIFTTRDCNLRCSYCYEKHEALSMPPAVYAKINNVFNSLLSDDTLEYVVYRLSGGEPLMQFKTWKPFIEDFLSADRNKKFVSLITNMTILTDEILDFFVNHNIGFGISLDGVSESKPFANRTSSAPIVRANIDRLLARKDGRSNNIDISTVINAQSIGEINVLAQWVAERNLNWGIYLDHFFCGEISMAPLLDKLFEAIEVLDHNGYDLYNKFKFNNVKITSKYDGCTAGKNLIAIDVDGKVFPCQTSIYGEPISNIMTTKNLIEDLKAQSAYKVGYSYELPKECEGCAIADICGGGCKLHNQSENKKYTCEIMKHVITKTIQTILKEDEQWTQCQHF